VNTFTVVTLFPELVDAFAATGIVRRAREGGRTIVDTVNPRAFSADDRGRVDDAPYGGGPGMVMMVQPLRAAIAKARNRLPGNSTVVYLTPQGRRIDQRLIAELTTVRHLILVAGRYEGIDERIVERDIDLELSLGDFVMSGGEVAAMAVIDAIVRLLPGSLGSELSAKSDSFSAGILEHPQYTRPESIDEQSVPSVLLSGNHAEIARWRQKQSLGRTWLKRPDLLVEERLTDVEKLLLEEFRAEVLETGDKIGDGN
jgi:tRNA (guanine37-N1)-methyltransferase